MIMRRVEDKTFTDAVVHVTGNAYSRCEFHNCTFVFQGFPCGLDTCKFHGSHLWRLEFTVHDSDQWDEFISVFAAMITKSLPKVSPPANDRGG